ncbi:MAG: M81 family metallopeptidase [Acidimicrobiia bacterium]
MSSAMTTSSRRPLRIGIASIMQESNTFNPVPTRLAAFHADYFLRGTEVFERLDGAQVEVGGFLDVLRSAAAQPVPLLAAHACSGGVVEDVAFMTMLDELVARCEADGPFDALLLALHGAMASESEPDAEGALLETLRRRFPGVPIAASLDLHAHVTPRMVANADLLVAYQAYPHTDMRETGQRAAELLLAMLGGKIRPQTALAKLPLIVSPVNARTGIPPLDAIVEEARRHEDEGNALAVSLFPVQPWLDVPDLGFAALVVTDGDEASARAIADDLAEKVWAVRDAFEPELVPLSDALALARNESAWPTVIGDAGDAPSCGATGDSPVVLRALLEARFDEIAGDVLVTLCDPPAARAAAAAGIGASVVVDVGHALTRASDDRVRLEGKVVALRDTPFTLDGPGAHGMPLNAGQMAVIRVGALHVVLTSIPAMEWDPSPYRAVGLAPETSAITFVKSPSHFRVAYQPIARHVLIADTPGASRCNMRRLHFTRVGHPLYPVEEGFRHAT